MRYIADFVSEKFDIIDC